MKKNSFTLLEAIFAISMLALAISGSFALISRLLSFSPQIQSKLIAYYLAQEGIEIVRNIRDTNWVEGALDLDWYKNIFCCQPPPYNCSSPPCNCNCQADYDDSILSTFIGNPLNLENTPSYRYGYGAGNSTKFVRKIKVSTSSTSTVEVEVEVSWQEKGQTQSVKVIEHLYNWR